MNRMDMKNQDRDISQVHRSYYSKPMCSMIEIKEKEMIAASPDPTTPPSEPSLNPPSKDKEEVTDPNPAKKHPGFNVWNTWD